MELEVEAIMIWLQAIDEIKSRWTTYRDITKTARKELTRSTTQILI